MLWAICWISVLCCVVSQAPSTLYNVNSKSCLGVQNNAQRCFFQAVTTGGTSTATWATGRTWCQGMGSDLAYYESATEQSSLSSYISTSINNNYWLGISDSTTEGTPRLTTGAALPYSNFDTTTDNSATNDCVYARRSSSYRWRYTTCTGSNRVVCRVDNQVTAKRGERCFSISATEAKCYFHLNGQNGGQVTYSWQEANTFCVSNAGTLATITSATEQTQLQNLVSLEAITFDYWIGLSDIAVESTFVWADGKPFSYTNYVIAGGNNAAARDCFKAVIASSQGWSADTCTFNRKAVCSRYRAPQTTQICYNVSSTVQKCFFEAGVVGTTYRWDAANTVCRSGGGTLASILSVAEKTFIDTLASEKRLFKGLGNYWIGLNDFRRDGTYEWVDDSVVNYTNWDTTTGATLANDCVYADSTQEFRWRVQACTTSIADFFCSKYIFAATTTTPAPVPTTPVPETTPAPFNVSVWNESCIDLVEYSGQKCFFRATPVGASQFTKCSWAQADAACRQVPGGTSVSILSQEEQLFVQEFAKNQSLDNDFWIGLSDLQTESEYVWADDTDVVYTNWFNGQPYDGEPDYGGRDCGFVEYFQDSKWGVQNCEWKKYSMCSRYTVGTPPPRVPENPTEASGVAVVIYDSDPQTVKNILDQLMEKSSEIWDDNDNYDF
jgi:hypothetical protein